MQASLELELIGYNDGSFLRSQYYFVKRSMGRHAANALIGDIKCLARYGVTQVMTLNPVEGRDINCKVDYTRSNSKRSRGIYGYYILQSGYLYYVQSPITWRNTERYFCYVHPKNGNIVRLHEDEVHEKFAELADELFAENPAADWSARSC